MNKKGTIFPPQKKLSAAAGMHLDKELKEEQMEEEITRKKN